MIDPPNLNNTKEGVHIYVYTKDDPLSRHSSSILGVVMVSTVLGQRGYSYFQSAENCLKNTLKCEDTVINERKVISIFIDE